MTDRCESPRIAVCLSGGGFRASMYGLGVLRYIAEAGLLDRVKVLVGVSGGSITASCIAIRYPRLAAAGHTEAAFMEHVWNPFWAMVCDHNVRNRALARWLLARTSLQRGGRLAALADTLDERLYDETIMAGLPSEPQLIITTTDLSFGRAFRFSRDFAGSWDHGYSEGPSAIRLAQAVAASAAVPMLFPPWRIGHDAIGLPLGRKRLILVDGGVYDNLGLEWLQGWGSGRPSAAVEPDFLMVVNASGPLRSSSRAFRGLSALGRVRKVQYAQTQTTRVRWLVDDLVAGRRHGIYLGITGDPRRYRDPTTYEPVPESYSRAALPSELVGPLADLRTDLNRFSELEAGLLAYHGYRSTHARLAYLNPRLAAPKPRWTQYGSMSAEETASALQALTRWKRQRGPESRLR